MSQATAENPLVMAPESGRLAHMVGTTSRTIERVPALFVGLLDAAGKLPQLPREVADLGRYGQERAATLAEVADLTWLVAWEGPRVGAMGFERASGIGAFIDRFDYHSSSDVREIVHLAGSRRAVIDLIKNMLESAREIGRRCIGSIDMTNFHMLAVLSHFGKQTRVVFEDVK